MMKKDSDAFINFIKALENDEQGHVAERLKNPDGPGTPIHLHIIKIQKSTKNMLHS